MSANASRFIANHLRIAASDLEGARRLNGDPPNRNAIYLCAQAGEKVMRAVLTSESEDVGREHRFEGWLKRIPDENPLKAEISEIAELEAYTTSFRYPTPNIPPSPTREETDEYIRKVENLLNRALSCFGVDRADPKSPARSPGPIRAKKA